MKNVICVNNNIGKHFEITQGKVDKPYKVIFPLTKRLREDTIHVVKGDEKLHNVELYIYTNTKEEAEKIRAFCISHAKDINDTLCWSGFFNIRAVRMLKYEV